MKGYLPGGEVLNPRSAPVVLLFLWFAASASAHDTWLVAERNQTGASGMVRVAVVTAEEFPNSDHATDANRVAEWVVLIGEKKHSVGEYAIDGDELAAMVHLEGPGLHTIGVALKPRFIEIDPEGFAAYLEDEGATAALEHRTKNNQGAEPGRELYAKNVTTFVEVGGGADDTSVTPAGHKIEIIPLSNPCRWKAGDEIAVRVLFEGRPVSGFRVSAGHEGLAKHTFVAHERTDANGQARFKLTRPGLWFLRTHTIRPVAPEVTEADWESFWASITFRVHGQGDRVKEHAGD